MLAEHKPLTSLLWNGKDLWQPFPPWMSVLVGLGNPYIPLSHVISGSSIIIKYVFQPSQHNLSNESLRQWWLQVFILSVQMSMAFCSTTTLEQILKLGSQCCGSDVASHQMQHHLTGNPWRWGCSTRKGWSLAERSLWLSTQLSPFEEWRTLPDTFWNQLNTEYREEEVKICQACKSGLLAVEKVYLLRQHVVRKKILPGHAERLLIWCTEFASCQRPVTVGK